MQWSGEPVGAAQARLAPGVEERGSTWDELVGEGKRACSIVMQDLRKIIYGFKKGANVEAQDLKQGEGGAHPSKIQEVGRELVGKIHKTCVTRLYRCMIIGSILMHEQKTL